uniref:Uncharacterized protein n=1 Tax=Heliothis virescens TaxID=7102 RepID=A0A2A4ITY6_HELVI
MASEEKLLRKIEKYNRKLLRRRNRQSVDRDRSPLRVSSDNEEAHIVQTPEVEPDETENTEIVEALGQEYDDVKKYEGHINHDISKRWNYLLSHGLSKTERDEILKCHTLPENCQLLDSPTLNEEVKAVISETGSYRDKGIANQQKQMGTALTIIGKVMSQLINNTSDKITTLKSLTEASKLICDLHYQLTKTRRSLVAPQLDKNFLEMTQNTIRNEYLYGDNLSERIKTNKIIQQSSNSIKKTVPKPAIAKNNNTKQMGNRNGPPRQANQRQPAKGMAQGGPRMRQQPSQRRPSYNPPHRSERTRRAHYNNRK